MDVMLGLTAVGKALEIARSLKELEGQFNDASFKLKIAELHSALADAKISLADAKIELAEKDAEIAALQKVQSDRLETIFHRGYNFGIDRHGISIGLPFCPVCEKTDGLQIQLNYGRSGDFLCPKCKGIFSEIPYELPAHLLPKQSDG